MINKFLAKTQKIGDCLEWLGAFNTDGYPRIVWEGNTNGKLHRIVFFLKHGYYPPVVRHSCDNPKCINPDHLLAGTPSVNTMDRNERGRTFGHVNEEELMSVKSLRERGLTYKAIGTQLQINPKRAEYILTRKGGG